MSEKTLEQDEDGWERVRTVGYDGRYDYGDDYDRRACGGVVHIERRVVDGVEQKRAVTTNGRFQFVTMIRDTKPTIRGFTTWGKVRGGSGRVHTTREAAERELEEDRRGCASQRGYSDRSVCVVGVDGILYHDEHCREPVWPSSGRSNGAVRFPG